MDERILGEKLFDIGERTSALSSTYLEFFLARMVAGIIPLIPPPSMLRILIIFLLPHS